MRLHHIPSRQARPERQTKPCGRKRAQLQLRKCRKVGRQAAQGKPVVRWPGAVASGVAPSRPRPDRQEEPHPIAAAIHVYRSASRSQVAAERKKSQVPGPAVPCCTSGPSGPGAKKMARGWHDLLVPLARPPTALPVVPCRSCPVVLASAGRRVIGGIARRCECASRLHAWLM